MAEQPLDKLKPDNLVAKPLAEQGHQEPVPGQLDGKNSRLGELLTGGEWAGQDVRLIVWRDDLDEWWMWMRQ